MDIFKIMKEGEFMTRICAVANNNHLVVSSDTLLTSSNGDRIHTIKIFSNETMIVGCLGALELNTNQGVIKITNIVKEILSLNQDNLTIIKNLEKKIADVYSYFRCSIPIQIICLFKENKHFYAYCFQVKSFKFGSVDTFKPFGKICKDNIHKFLFHNYILDTGEGANNLLDIHSIDENAAKNPQKLSQNIVETAINDSKLKTVGGKCQSLELLID